MAFKSKIVYCLVLISIIAIWELWSMHKEKIIHQTDAKSDSSKSINANTLCKFKDSKTTVATTTVQNSTESLLKFTTTIISDGSPELKPLWQHVPFKTSKNLPVILTKEKTEKTIEFLYNVTQMLIANDIEHMILYGTLLGSYLSHTILAWDDDLDVIILDKHAYKLENLFKTSTVWNDTISYIYQCQGRDELGCIWVKYKLYWTQSPWPGRHSWSVPFVDVTSYGVNDTHMWLNNNRPLLFPINVIYPLHKRPFGGIWVSSPQVPYEILNSLYWTFMNKGTHQMVCAYPYWDHWHQKTRNTTYKPVPCQNLTSFYPFVERSITDDGQTKEELTIGNTTYYTFINDEPFDIKWQPKKYELNWVASGPGLRERNIMQRLLDRKMQKIAMNKA